MSVRLHPRDEEHGGLLVAGMLPDHRCQFKAVDLGHMDIKEDDGDLVFHEEVEGFAAGVRREEVLPQFTEDRRIREEFGRVIIHQEDIDGLRVVHGLAPVPDRRHAGGVELQTMRAISSQARASPLWSDKRVMRHVRMLHMSRSKVYCSASWERAHACPRPATRSGARAEWYGGSSRSGKETAQHPACLSRVAQSLHFRVSTETTMRLLGGQAGETHRFL